MGIPRRRWKRKSFWPSVSARVLALPHRSMAALSRGEGMRTRPPKPVPHALAQRFSACLPPRNSLPRVEQSDTRRRLAALSARLQLRQHLLGNFFQRLEHAYPLKRDRLDDRLALLAQLF